MIPCDHTTFRKLSFIPYNAIVASFLARRGNIAEMRDEQRIESTHRKIKLRENPNMDQTEWAGFNLWLDQAERGLIDQIEQHVSNGDLLVPITPDEMEIAAWHICSLVVQPFGTWVPSDRMPRLNGGMIEVVPTGVFGRKS